MAALLTLYRVVTYPDKCLGTWQTASPFMVNRTEAVQFMEYLQKSKPLDDHALQEFRFDGEQIHGLSGCIYCDDPEGPFNGGTVTIEPC